MNYGLIEQPRFEGTLKNHLVQPLVWRRSSKRLPSTSFTCTLKNSYERHSPMSSRRFFLWLIFFTGEKKSPGATFTHCPVSLCDLLRKECFHPLCTCSLSTGRLWWGPLETFPGRRDFTPSVFHHKAGFTVIWLFCGLPLKSPQSICAFLNWGAGTGLIWYVKSGRREYKNRSILEMWRFCLNKILIIDLLKSKGKILPLDLLIYGVDAIPVYWTIQPYLLCKKLSVL